MRRLTNTRYLLSTLAVSSLLMAFWFLHQSGSCQINCTPLSADEPRWPAGANIYILRGAGWSDIMLEGAIVGIENWNQINTQSEILVSYDYLHSPPSANAPTMVLEWGTLQQNSNDPNVQRAVAITERTLSGGYLHSVRIVFDASVTTANSMGQQVRAISTLTGVSKAVRHEVGHTQGFGESVKNYDSLNSNGQCVGGQVSGSTVMNDACGPNDDGNNQPSSVTECDRQRAIDRMSRSPSGTPTPTPTPTPESWVYQPVNSSCPSEIYNECIRTETWRWDESTCTCVCDDGYGCFTPILFDKDGDGIRTTSRSEGVYFDLDSDGLAELISWTVESSDDSWLAKDRNNNGKIDNGSELVGGFSPQPPPPPGQHKNGFLALAEEDKAENGGNNDRKFNRFDAAFDSYLLWRDSNHNGISESNELTKLSEFRIPRGTGFLSPAYPEISLDYRLAGHRGYVSRINPEGEPSTFRWLLDVFLARK